MHFHISIWMFQNHEKSPNKMSPDLWFFPSNFAYFRKWHDHLSAYLYRSDTQDLWTSTSFLTSILKPLTFFLIFPEKIALKNMQLSPKTPPAVKTWMSAVFVLSESLMMFFPSWCGFKISKDYLLYQDTWTLYEIPILVLINQFLLAHSYVSSLTYHLWLLFHYNGSVE